MRLAPLATLCALALLTTACGSSHPPAALAPEIGTGYRSGLQPVHAKRHMAAAANPLATAAGLEMLRKGGSAIDAAVAMQAVLTLVEPQSSGIGGGAFILYWDGRQVQAYDGRETAPQGASAMQFLKPDGTPMAFAQAQIGGLSVGVPGALRALELAHRQHGKLPWKTLFGPAIELARNGFAVSPRLHALIAADRFIARSPELARYLLTPEGKPLPVGSQLKNPALADTLQAIASEGADALYQGRLAQAITRQVNRHANPGSLALADLAAYRAVERQPVCADYKQWRICGMPPPSSGGVAVLQTLGILEALGRHDPRQDIARMPPVAAATPAGLTPDANAVHLVAEAERLAYADRAQYLADPGFVPVNVKGLTSSAYLDERARLIGERSMGHAEAGVPPGANLALAPDRSPLRISTSQVSVVDSLGGALSMTTSVEAAFGSHLLVEGFLLNNQLTDFSFIPEEHGLPVANRIEPGKRPRSSMAPTLVFERSSGQLVATLGSPGGSQIIQYVNKALLGLLDWKLDPQAAVGLPNFGSRNVQTEVEAGLVGPQIIRQLRARGHDVAELEMTSGTQVIVRDGEGWAAGADPRREGSAAGD
ncbi:gamma-glutamyltransferase [Pseudomonas xanthosomatis]|uniref:gamma-glutamyltransferase n=1 Tax=Pseudomonas xanthosomatis TaxID=2842356 RepID=UPI001C3E469F|nr:gamma-glutamyltransferase [Pseudomonas xanthosomatis]QXH44791.1 gamma-glutamyltransferase [Pseudomonas xanthosomatis]